MSRTKWLRAGGDKKPTYNGGPNKGSMDYTNEWKIMVSMAVWSRYMIFPLAWVSVFSIVLLWCSSFACERWIQLQQSPTWIGCQFQCIFLHEMHDMKKSSSWLAKCCIIAVIRAISRLYTICIFSDSMPRTIFRLIAHWKKIPNRHHSQFGFCALIQCVLDVASAFVHRTALFSFIRHKMGFFSIRTIILCNSWRTLFIETIATKSSK